VEPEKENSCPEGIVTSKTVLMQYSIHYHLEVQANQKKLWHKKPMLFLASMGETGLSHDIFFKFSLRPFEVVEVE
jgi:hypothetical protein